MVSDNGQIEFHFVFCFLFMLSLEVLLFLFLAQTTQKKHCGVQNCKTAPVQHSFYPVM